MLAEFRSEHGDAQQAVDEAKQATELQPNSAEAQWTLGNALMRELRFAEATAAFQRASELSSIIKDWPQVTKQRLERARLCLAVQPRMAAILAGTEQSRNREEKLAAATICYYQHLYVRAARFCVEAFCDQAALAEDHIAGNRFKAARAAALAGAGLGDDQAKGDEASRAKWRKQALEWLKADLVHWSIQAKSADASVRSDTRIALAQWKAAHDLASIRDEGALKKLPADEQKAFAALWSEVDAITARASAGAIR